MPKWQQTWILRKLQNSEKVITVQMSQAAEVCLLNKVMSKDLEERMSLKECAFLLNPAYELRNAGFSFLRNCKLTLGQQ